ncbi:RagB/SusD family nutrient uptake outer membrane protein, partial [Bacillus pumilus]
SDIGTANKKQWTAEARFLRAFYYFNLVQGWGDVPFTTSSTKTVKGLSIPRTDKETIYDFIVKEMDESANDLLSASTLNYRPGRVSKSAAWGILARVLMFRAGEHYRDGKSADNSEILKYFRQA